MPAHLHHVVMRSHSAQTFVAFLTDVVGMEVQFQMRVPGEILEKTLGWPPSDGADVTMLGTGDAGLVEVLDVPRASARHRAGGPCRAVVSHRRLRRRAARRRRRSPTTSPHCDTGMPGVDLFFCTMGGVPMEFMGAYAPEANSGTSDATNS